MADKKEKKAKKPKVKYIDDGRTIADMSGLDGGFSSPFGKKKKAEEKPAKENPYNEPIMTKKETMWYVFGALKAALLIAGAFIVGLGALILLMCLLWR